tara:strand:+ start:551 stop:1252 length:702 start_codon:yes stop_codon:yes gene_type:complete
MKKDKILFIGRKDDYYCNKAYKILKKNFTNIKVVWSSFPGEKYHRHFKKKFDYIFSLRGYFILNKKTLSNVKEYAINFHPSIPKYRGFSPTNYAIIDGLNYHGCTAHIMSEKLDSGQILNVKKFRISNKDNLNDILTKTYKYQLKQFQMIVNKIIQDKGNLSKLIKSSKKEKWAKKIRSKRDIDKLYEINLNQSKKKILNQLRATILNNSRFLPYIKKDNVKYVIIKEKLNES